MVVVKRHHKLLSEGSGFRIQRYPYAVSIIYGVVLFTLLESLWASSPDELAAHYRDLTAQIKDSPFHAPVAVRSDELDNTVSAEVHGVLNQPFSVVAEVLGEAQAWCAFMTLSLHIKACTWNSATSTLTLYVGTKDYQTPEEAYEVQYGFKTNRQSEQILVELESARGPMGTKRNRLAVEAMAINGETILHFKSSIEMSTASRLATTTYLATLGRHRIGFSLVDDGEGEKTPIKGVQGMIERNAMRYYLALQTHMEQRKEPETHRFEQSINAWYDLTERYHDQLYEVSREDYIENKKNERLNQTAMQRRIDAASR